MNASSPILVTIGMPVFNGESVLRETLESIISQTFKNFRLVISDNASTDMTEMICREFLNRDGRVNYFRQARNIGLEANFDFVLSKADTKYFMWAPADDVRSDEFLEENVRFLEENPDFIASTCPVRFKGGQFDPINMGDQSCEEIDPFERILKYLASWHANGRLFSLFRTECLRDTKFSRSEFLGGDWALMIGLLKKGRFKRLDTGFIELGNKGISNSTDIFARYRKGALCWAIPFYGLSVRATVLFRKSTFNQKGKLLLRLWRLNFAAFKTQIKFALKS